MFQCQRCHVFWIKRLQEYDANVRAPIEAKQLIKKAHFRLGVEAKKP